MGKKTAPEAVQKKPRSSRASIRCGRGETGRRKGLKIPRPSVIRVRLPSSAPKVAPGRGAQARGRRVGVPCLQEKSSVESFRRALIVAGSTAPQTSKNCINCSRAIVVPGPVAFARPPARQPFIRGPRAIPAAPPAAPTRQLSMTLRFTRRTRPWTVIRACWRPTPRAFDHIITRLTGL